MNYAEAYNEWNRLLRECDETGLPDNLEKPDRLEFIICLREAKSRSRKLSDALDLIGIDLNRMPVERTLAGLLFSRQEIQNVSKKGKEMAKLLGERVSSLKI